MKRLLSLFAVTFLCFMGAYSPALALEVGAINGKKIKGGEHISIRVSGKVEPRVSMAEDNPPRVVVALPSAHWKAEKSDYSSKLVSDIRLSDHDENSSWLVMELSGDARVQQVKLTGDKRKGYRIEFDLIQGEGREDIRKKAEQFKPRGKPVVVIDAGHGGQDPGAMGQRNREKFITLRYAQTLKDTLNKTGRYRVVLTRSDDRYLFLRERVKLAREAKGSLFISLHADSAPSGTARGLSVYTISETASDKEAEALAAMENKVDIIGGIDLSGTDEDVADILIDLAERETRGKSAQFAKLVLRNLAKEITLLSNSHRYAGFAVLKAPDIPSILVEIGFLSSAQEERLLESDSYRRKVAQGIARAVDDYFKKR